MRRDGPSQFIEPQARQIEQTVAAVQKQSGVDLLLNAGDKRRRALHIERHDDDAARQRTEKSRYPLGAVLAPEQDALAFVDAAMVKFAGELIGRVAQSLVR